MNSPTNYFLLLVRRKTMPGQTSLSCTLTAAGFSVIAAFRITHHPAVSKLLNTRKEECKVSGWEFVDWAPKLPLFQPFPTLTLSNTTHTQLSLQHETFWILAHYPLRKEAQSPSDSQKSFQLQTFPAVICCSFITSWSSSYTWFGSPNRTP